jgi:hypothetical protein
MPVSLIAGLLFFEFAVSCRPFLINPMFCLFNTSVPVLNLCSDVPNPGNMLLSNGVAIFAEVEKELELFASNLLFMFVAALLIVSDCILPEPNLLLEKKPC